MKNKDYFYIAHRYGVSRDGVCDVDCFAGGAGAQQPGRTLSEIGGTKMKLALGMLFLVLALGFVAPARAQTGQGFEEKGKPVYHIAFVQAKPGKEREYRQFAIQVFKPMWVEAVKAGIVESWTAYEHPVYFGSGVGYTHVLIVKAKNFATFDTFIADLVKVSKKLFPNRDIQAEAVALMEIVKSDVLYEFANTAEAMAETKPVSVDKKE